MSIKDKLLSGSLGFGAAPLGNMFRNIPDNEAAATVDAVCPTASFTMTRQTARCDPSTTV
jgi:hypothetical protein